ncbi:U5 snRNP GTPase SNU114 [Sugiyamaella lignohabitans]|uniref:U5 snRNP GTPase SNU114 n=1 Tax=Sugiyamaella lignohabitans TaxID=796027 RepID=A0A167F681_9ASCO|nr:U5 snRNP GTPase SNU114 [Sugiyamaella lignohabitans]ANB14888.1 U5 snRNP GTPase SNU114 [Sugiyamaella lignohabitans]
MDQGPITSVSTSIVLHEDKKYYPDAEEVFGRDVETLIQDTDTQSLSEPIIAPIKTKVFSVEESELPEVFYSRAYQANLMGLPDQIRNVAIAGQIHHGKTSLVDMLVTETHDLKAFEGRKEDEQFRYTDTHVLERDRGISIRCSPISLLLQNGKGKSHLFNIIDTPGHVDFIDEVAVAARLVDGMVVVVDVIEGLQINTRQVLQHIVQEGLSFVVVINKIDRLILDLKLPPVDAYYKILHVLDTINDFLKTISPLDPKVVSPHKGNVVFSSASMEWCFTVKSFAAMYSTRSSLKTPLDVDEFSKRLWGNIYYNPESKKFTRKNLDSQGTLTFVHFILLPLYKIYGQVIGESAEDLQKTLSELSIHLKPFVYKMNSKPLLKIVCKEFFGTSSALVDSILACIPSPVEGAKRKIQRTYTGPQQDSKLVESMYTCNQDGPLAVNVAKLFTSSDGSETFALGRVISGTLNVGDEVRVLGDNYTLEDEEDMAVNRVSELWIPNTRYKVAVNAVPAGNWVLIGGVDSLIVKTATLVSTQLDEDAYIFQPIKYVAQTIFKVAVEPVNPSELPKLLDGLRKVTKTYSLLQTKVEESGEHVLLASGEMYMDCVLHDLRLLYTEMNIKVSDPVTRFSETCVETSAIKAFTETPNKRSKITIIAEPLEKGIAEDIEAGKIKINEWPARKVGKYFQENFQWDALSARSIWAFGPDNLGPNILLDDTLPDEVDKNLLNAVSGSIKQGFRWSTREGPLCEEPIRSTKFRILDAVLSDELYTRGGAQIITTARRACYSSFLLAAPRLLEPIYLCNVTCPGDAVAAVYGLLRRRRGEVLSDSAIPGTPLYLVEGVIPVIDSFGFETDLRVATRGRAFVSLVFDQWQIVPGDPLDREQVTKPLTPALPTALARDFVLKTRRRKGLSEEPTIDKYLDESVLESLRDSGLIDRF